MADGKFQLIDIGSDFAYEFPFFPETIRSMEGANWQPQETTIGIKPLFYANGEPRGVSVDELYLDSTDTDTSLKPDLDLLRLFKTELEEGGPPPPMLAVWGDNEFRCVLTRLDIEEIYFNPEGLCTRAKIGIELLELQPDGEATGVELGDDT